MNKGLKIGGLACCLVALVVASYVLYTRELINYLVVTGTFSGITLVMLINTIITTRSEESMYKSNLRQILKTYDSVLVRSKNLPKLDEKNIIRVDSIEDLVDAQMEIRKPIYYQEQTESCAFVLLDNSEACVYILKLNEEVLCPLEIELEELEIKQKNSTDKESTTDEILKDIERTTIVRVNKNKYVKVSPIRKKKNKEEAEQVEENKVQEENNNVQQVEEVKQEEVKETVTEQPVEDMPQEVSTNDIVEEKADEVSVNETVEVENEVNEMEDKKQEAQKEIEVLEF